MKLNTAYILKVGKTHSDILEEINKDLDNSIFSVLYSLAKNVFFGREYIHREFAEKLRRIILKGKDGKTIVQKTSVIDLTKPEVSKLTRKVFGVSIPDVYLLLNTAIVFVILQSVAGFFRELGKDFYNFFKKDVKRLPMGTTKIIKVLLVAKEKNYKFYYTFLFFDYFDEKTFIEAWNKMLTFDLLKHTLISGENGVFVFDTKQRMWKLVG